MFWFLMWANANGKNKRLRRSLMKPEEREAERRDAGVRLVVLLVIVVIAAVLLSVL